MLWAWLFLVAGVIALGTSPPKQAQAHAPYIVNGSTIVSYGARSVQANYEQGFQWPNPNLEKIALVDSYGLPAGVKSSPFYPTIDYVWNHDDNLHTWVAETSHSEGDANWQEGGTTIWIEPHDGEDPPDTHIHLWTWVWRGYWAWEQWNDLQTNAAYVGYIYLRAFTLECCGDDTAATVLAHEVGHALGMEDEPGGHGGSPSTIMEKPIVTQRPSYEDRRVEDYCIWVTGVYPC